MILFFFPLRPRRYPLVQRLLLTLARTKRGICRISHSLVESREMQMTAGPRATLALSPAVYCVNEDDVDALFFQTGEGGKEAFHFFILSLQRIAVSLLFFLWKQTSAVDPYQGRKNKTLCVLRVSYPFTPQEERERNHHAITIFFSLLKRRDVATSLCVNITIHIIAS